MKETLSGPPDIDPKRSGAHHPAANGFPDSSSTPQLQPLSFLNEPSTEALDGDDAVNNHNHNVSILNANIATGATSATLNEKKPQKPAISSSKHTSRDDAFVTSSQAQGQGAVVEMQEKPQDMNNRNNSTASHPSNDNGSITSQQKKRRTFVEETRRTFWLVITHSWLNVLLVFVPLGIILAQIKSVPGGVVFAVNCIAVIPLAGMLSFATESVASKMGDALGALLNVTFGNAVELIIFIALVKNQIRIVQASLLGSILANLLLILGMGFFLGGLRYREQIYNSTVTQMSACLLSLSVISLVLPTAFHASFSDTKLADKQSLKISRGTSVILLLVYILYLVFQLKSHAYMYESTPQHLVDAESIPGPAAAWLDSSSSDSSSSGSSDSDDSRDTVRRRMKKVLRGGRRRKSSVASVDTVELNAIRKQSIAAAAANSPDETISESSSSRPKLFPRTSSKETNEEATDDEGEKWSHRRSKKHRLRQKRKMHKKKHHHNEEGDATQPAPRERVSKTAGEGEPRRVDFALPNVTTEPLPNHSNEHATGGGTRRPFPALRAMSVKSLAPTVFVQGPQADLPAQAPAGHVPRVRYGIRRTNSLPDRLTSQHQVRPPGAMLPSQISRATIRQIDEDNFGEPEDEHLTKWASVILLLVTTGLVAACAEFLIATIEDVTSSTSIGEIFIGLIILPIVGNAAEHVTAITVAMKNKMDLAIGVAVGSSIQIAIFVTPLVVILGWILDKDMTLYFTLFETVCLFVSAFMVNFLVLDGRSNYLEGALLCAVYCIIAVVAFFYPDGEDASSWGN